MPTSESTSCKGCQLPETLKPGMNVLLWLPQGHSQHKIATYLSDQGYAFENLITANAVRLCPPEPTVFVLQIMGLLTAPEQADTRVLFFEGAEPSLADYGNMMTVDALSRRYRGQWVIDLLREKRLTSAAQPIVSADSHEVFGHEFLMRGFEETGEIVMPGTLLESASDPRILFNLDRDARISAVEIAARHVPEGRIFINFSPGSVYDPGVCLRTTVNAILKHDIDPKRVVFEVVETDKVKDLNHLNGIVRFYRNAGFSIALDDFGSGFNNLGTYLALAPDFIKLDKSIVRDVVGNPRSQDMVAGFIRECRPSDTRIIAEGIEDQTAADTLRDTGADFLQGYHFGQPRLFDGWRAAA